MVRLFCRQPRLRRCPILRAAANWRDGGYHLFVSLLLAVAGYGVLLLLVLTLVAAAPGGAGVPLLRRVLARAHALADVQRRRWRLETPAPQQPLPDSSKRGPFMDLRALLAPARTRRELLWLASPLQVVLPVLEVQLVLVAVAGVLMPLTRLVLPSATPNYLGIVVDDTRSSLLAVPNGVLFAALAVWALAPMVQIEGRQTRRLLGVSAVDRLHDRVAHLTQSRTTAVDASATELRRIERDLHDGAQARLVSLAMTLGMAQDLLPTDPQRAATLMATARSQASTATTELRSLVRGIYPPLLADRGLGGALHALALDCPLPVALDVQLARRLSAPLESAAYFAVVEALTNAVKHSGATRVEAAVSDEGDCLFLRVADDGRGGADPDRGTGLRGIEHRVAVFDGSVRVDSPAGGPTSVEIVLPCAS